MTLEGLLSILATKNYLNVKKRDVYPFNLLIVVE